MGGGGLHGRPRPCCLRPNRGGTATASGGRATIKVPSTPHHPLPPLRMYERCNNKMDTESQKALVNKYVELWDTGNLALADEVLAADFVDHAHPEFSPGPASVKQAVADFRAAFPDARVTIEQMISEGDTVALRLVLRGTHQGNFAGFPPTGKQAVLYGMDFIRIANGKLVELWNSADTLNWVLQLGATVSFPQSRES